MTRLYTLHKTLHNLEQRLGISIRPQASRLEEYTRIPGSGALDHAQQQTPM